MRQGVLAAQVGRSVSTSNSYSMRSAECGVHLKHPLSRNRALSLELRWVLISPMASLAMEHDEEQIEWLHSEKICDECQSVFDQWHARNI